MCYTRHNSINRMGNMKSVFSSCRVGVRLRIANGNLDMSKFNDSFGLYCCHYRGLHDSYSEPSEMSAGLRLM